MAIGTPATLGTNGTTSSVSSIGLTTTANIVSGDLVVVGISLQVTATTVTSVSDGTNSYTKATGFSSANFCYSDLWYCQNCSAVASGGTITATFSGATGGGGTTIQAARVSGILTSSSLDQTAALQTNSATPSVTTGALSQSEEVAFGFASNSVNSAYTESSGFSALSTRTANSDKSNLSYNVLASSSAVTFSPTWGAASSGTDGGLLVATFKGIPTTFITGASGTGAAGTARGAVDKALTGAAGSGFAGSITPQVGGIAVGVFGQGQVGSLSKEPAANPTGVSGTGQAGTLRDEVSAFASGVFGIGQAGIIGPSTTLVGVQGEGEVGEIFPIPPSPRTRAPLLIPSQNGLPASLWLGNPNNGG